MLIRLQKYVHQRIISGQHNERCGVYKRYQLTVLGGDIVVNRWAKSAHPASPCIVAKTLRTTLSRRLSANW